MSTQLDNGVEPAVDERGRRACRRLLTGLTPQAFALVAALMFARAMSSNIEMLVVQAHTHHLGAWFEHLFNGFAMLVLMAVPMLVGVTATANLGPRRGPPRFVALAAAVLLSTLAGLILRMAVQDWLGTGSGWGHFYPFMSYLWPRYALLCGMLTVAAEFYRREVASIEAMQRAELERAALEREMAEARLQALQAQIEPHFLFNTLANVRRLYDKSPEAGRTMLDNLMRYLEVALPRMRESTTTLERDSNLVEAFLRVQQVRMGPRLAFSVDIPALLRAHPVPPMMLLTLVENAIKHGVNPSLRGGLVRVEARRDGERLMVSVADTGVGFAPGSGVGTGLANIRARLVAQFGDRADLELENNELGGLTATLVMPMALDARLQ
jgi:signal transduction histidine kinase